MQCNGSYKYSHANIHGINRSHLMQISTIFSLLALSFLIEGARHSPVLGLALAWFVIVVIVALASTLAIRMFVEARRIGVALLARGLGLSLSLILSPILSLREHGE